MYTGYSETRLYSTRRLNLRNAQDTHSNTVVSFMRDFLSLPQGVAVVFMILAAGNLSNLIELPVDYASKTDELRIWLVICFAVLLPCSWLGTPKEFWGIAVGASLATAVACLMICVCIVLDMPTDLKSVQQPTLDFECFFSGMLMDKSN